jgi:subtilisin family serine protease
VIDSAIDSAEPALAGVAVQVQAFVADPVASAHGTAIAVTIAGEGRLRGAKFYNAVVMGAHQEHASAASVESVVRALDWLMSVDVGVVNISLEGPYNRILERSLQRAADLGVIIVASNGNAGPTSPPRYPAAFSDVIAVTAIDAALQVYPQAVRGPHTDLAAPGVDLFVSLEQSGRYLSGTSYAAALVTAAVAASPLPQRRPGASVLARLSAGARDLGDPGHDDRFGHGLPQVGGVCPG